jgi:hypothetical protein
MGDELMSPGMGETIEDGSGGVAPSSLEQPPTPSVMAAPMQR